MTGTPLETDPRFWVLSEALASYAGDPNDPLVLEGGYLQAAVALVLRAREPLELLLIKRATSERDPWSGHMALPGGRHEESDPDLAATAVREALEEIGLPLHRHAKPLGRLDDVRTHTGDMIVRPYVWSLEEPVVLSPNAEVAVVFAPADVAADLGPLTARYAAETASRLRERRAASWQYPGERATALRSYAELNLALGDVEAALASYDDLLALGIPPAEEADVRYRYAVFLARRGDANRARVMLERARSLLPADERVAKLLDAIDSRK